MTIPSGVKILKVNTENVCPPIGVTKYVKVTPGATYYIKFIHISSRAGFRTAIGNYKNNKIWLNNGIGVLESSSRTFITYNPSEAIFYSSEINKETPTLYDEITSTQSLDTDSTNEAVTTPPQYLNNFIYPLSNQFGGIYLQLHSSAVSNPYTFSITSNKTFSAIAKASSPGTQLGPYKYNLCFATRTNGVNITIDNTSSEYLSIEMSCYRIYDNTSRWMYTLYLADGKTYNDSGVFNHSSDDEDPECYLTKMS